MATLATALIPQHDVLSLPGSVELFTALAVAFSWISLLLLSFIMGAAIFLCIRDLTPVTRSPLDQQLHRRISRTFPLALGLTVLTCLTALLFNQTLYTPYMIAAGIFMADTCWLGFILLAVAFTCVRLAASFNSRWHRGLTMLILALAIGTLMYLIGQYEMLAMQPEHWIAAHRGYYSLFFIADPIVMPRVLHKIGAAFGISGIFIVWIGRYRGESTLPPREQIRHADQHGLIWLLLGMGFQIPFGLWYMASMPADMRDILSRLSHTISVVMWLSAACVLISVIAAFLALVRPRRAAIWVALISILVPLSPLGMLIVNQAVTQNYLRQNISGNFQVHHWHITPQIPGMILFFAITTIVLLALAWLAWLVRSSQKKISPEKTS